MNRRITAALSIAALTLTGAAALPSEAAPKKKKAPIKGAYTLNLVPDATNQVLFARGAGCQGLLAQGQDRKPFTVPAAGTLTINLVGGDPAGRHQGFDWDMWLMAPGGSGLPAVGSSGLPYTGSKGVEIAHSTSPGATERIVHKFTKKAKVFIDVCNLTGTPAGKVTYTFVYA